MRKRCNGCGAYLLPEEEKRAKCKACTKKYNAAYYQRKKKEPGFVEWRRRNMREWGTRVNPDSNAAYEHHIRRNYGMSPDDYQALLKKQKGRCAVCLEKPKPDTRLCVDHEHETGRVRGLLCSPCNRSLGHFKDDAVVLRRAILYLGNT